MAINFKLGPQHSVDPDQDGMSRTWIGYSPVLSDQELYEQNRGTWVLGPRAAREEYGTFSSQGQVVVVVELGSIETIPAKTPLGRPLSAVVGRVLTTGEPGHDLLFGRQVDAHRNPVTYLDDEPGERLCRCGCGETVPQHRQFLPGHDQRAIHERITREWGDTLGFIKWFDQTYGTEKR